MKNISLFLSIPVLMVITMNFSTAQECAWARSAGGSLNDVTAAIVNDASGNVYVAGSYESDTMYFGASYIVNSASFGLNFYLAKYDSTGNLVWVKTFGGTNTDMVNGMAIDNSGNIYMTGTLGSLSLTLGSTTITNPTGSAIFLMKVNASGNVLWAKIAENTGNSAVAQGSAVTTDASGNVYITGDFQDSLKFPTLTITHTLTMLGNGVFVAKFDGSGNVIWAKSSEGEGDDVPNGIGLDGAGNIYVTGTWTSSYITFDGVTLTNTALDNNVYFLVKYNSSGTAVWGQSAGDSNLAEGTSVSCDAAGNVYVAGYYDSPTLTFGSTTLTNEDPTGNSADIFLVKYNASGAVTWAKNIGGTSEDEVRSMITDPAGNIFMCGSFLSPSISFGSFTLSNFGMYVAHFNSSGNAIWAKEGATLNAATATAVSRDAFGHVYVAGGYGLSLTLDAITLTDPSSPENYMFVAKLIDPSTGIPGVTENNVLSLYPNPAKDQLTITGYGNEIIKSIKVTDALGREVYWFHPQSLSTKMELQLPAIANGVYYLQVVGDGINGCIPFVIQR